MNIKQTIRNVMAGLLMMAGLTLFLVPTPTYAACDSDPDTACCGGIDTGIIACDQTGGGDVENSGLWGVLMMVINILSVGVGVAALAGIVYGSVLYTSAGGSQEQVKKAITIFTNVAIGIVAYAGMWALLNFLVPGGVFKG